MSQLSPSLLETHPTGTINTGGIINGNWNQLNNILGNTGDGAGILADAMAGAGVDYVTLDGAETLTNKVLTSPVLNTPTLTGAVLGTPASGNLANTTVDGTNKVGFRNRPQNIITTDITLALADSGKHFFHPVSDANTRTVTIPPNSSVPFEIGTEIMFVVPPGGDVLIITSLVDAFTWAPAGNTGEVFLTGPGIATLIKVGTTEWMITGVNLS